MCPECSARGENADEDCEANIKNVPCQETDNACILHVSTQFSPVKFKSRKCFNQKGFALEQSICDYYTTCAVAMCNTTGCKAEFPNSGKLLQEYTSSFVY